MTRRNPGASAYFATSWAYEALARKNLHFEGDIGVENSENSKNNDGEGSKIREGHVLRGFATRRAQQPRAPLLCHLVLAYLSPPYLVSCDASTNCIRA